MILNLAFKSSRVMDLELIRSRLKCLVHLRPKKSATAMQANCFPQACDCPFRVHIVPTTAYKILALGDAVTKVYGPHLLLRLQI